MKDLPKILQLERLEKEAIKRLKNGEELTGKEGILTPLC